MTFFFRHPLGCWFCSRPMCLQTWDWAQQIQRHFAFLEEDLVVLVGARTNKDGVTLISYILSFYIIVYHIISYYIHTESHAAASYVLVVQPLALTGRSMVRTEDRREVDHPQAWRHRHRLCATAFDQIHTAFRLCATDFGRFRSQIECDFFCEETWIGFRSQIVKWTKVCICWRDVAVELFYIVWIGHGWSTWCW